jgi:hypothetical protein
VYAPETEEQKLELSLTLWNPRAKAGAFAYALESRAKAGAFAYALETKSKSWSFRLRSGIKSKSWSFRLRSGNPRAKAGAFAYALGIQEQKLELSLTLRNPTRTLSPALGVEATS